MRKYQFLFALLALATFWSCRNDFDFEAAYNSVYSETVRAYNNSFTSTYGSVPSDWNWDMSSSSVYYSSGTRAQGTRGTSSVSGIDFGISNKTTVTKNKTIQTKINEVLPDGSTHSGNTAILTAPNNPFTIYPLFAQGAFTYDLYVKVGNDPEQLVFTKNWDDSSRMYCNGMQVKDPSSPKWNTKYITINMPGITIDTPAGTPIQIYLKNVSGYNGKNYQIGTSTGNAIVVETNLKVTDITLPNDAVASSTSKVKFIGIEDSVNESNNQITGVGGDKDYNDLVLMIVGKDEVPGELKIENSTYYKETKKRYMVEDLGATSGSDIDFNDLVVDLIDYEKHQVTITNGAMKDDVDTNGSYQEARIMALGGTLNVKFFVGGTNIFEKEKSFIVNGMSNTGYMGKDAESDPEKINYDTPLKTINNFGKPWNPAGNNVWVVVTPSDGKEYTINFPDNGTIPQMIATDVTVRWKSERKTIQDIFPEEWEKWESASNTEESAN